MGCENTIPRGSSPKLLQIAERFAYALRCALPSRSADVVLDAKNVPEPYLTLLKTEFPGPDPGKPRAIELCVRPIETAGVSSLATARGRILAEFPFTAPSWCHELYLSAYETPRLYVERLNRLLSRTLERRSAVRIEGNGHRFTIPLANAVISSDGVRLRSCKDTLQLPGGEVFAEFSHGAGDGTLLLDTSLTLGVRATRVDIKDGQVSSFKHISESGPPSGFDLLGTLGATVVEIGLGTNPGARPGGPGCLFEKALGTLHVGLSLEANLSGLVHIDFPILARWPEELRRSSITMLRHERPQ